MKRLLIAAIFISPSVFASYTTMTIEGVKQSNGVWTTAGVMDTQGFVRTTGAVTVHGTTRNLPVAMAADTLALGTAVKGAAKALGPIALAATAYDLYQFFNDNGIESQGNNWTIPVAYDDPSTITGYFQSPNGTSCAGAGNNASLSCLWGNSNAYKQYLAGDPKWEVVCTPLTLGTYCALRLKTGGTQLSTTLYTYGCNASTASLISCAPHPPAQNTDWDGLPALTIPLIISGLANIPSLKDYPIPFKSVSFTPYSEWLGDPYFKDGQWWRDRMDVSPSSTSGQPTRVRVDIGPVKLEGQTDPTVKPDDTPASENTQPKEQTKFCDDNPFSIACQEMGNPEEVEPIEPDEIQFQLDTNQSWGASNGACPASPSVTLFTGKVITFDYQPTCDFLALLRPIIIAFALMTAIFIALGRTD